MSLTARLIGEGIKHPERGRAKANAEPGDGGRLRLNERQAAEQELLDILLLPRLRFQTDK